MENEIEQIRTEICQYFDEKNKLPEERYELSEGGLFYFTSERYMQTDLKRNWVVCKIEIFNIETSEKLLEYITDADDNDFAACWFQKDNKDYLILPEAFQGQSIVDISQKQLHSFYSSQEPFIWQTIYPSPDGNKLAVEGCYWACPRELRIYDSTEIVKLPYLIVYQESNFDNDCTIEHWKNNDTLVVCRNQKEISEINLK